jgi:hypothetical protein
MPLQLRPMILFSEALTRFRNRGCESHHFERVNERIEQLIQNQLICRSRSNAFKSEHPPVPRVSEGTFPCPLDSMLELAYSTVEADSYFDEAATFRRGFT